MEIRPVCRTYFGIFQDRRSHVIEKLSPKPFESYGWTYVYLGKEKNNKHVLHSKKKSCFGYEGKTGQELVRVTFKDKTLNNNTNEKVFLRALH